MNHNNTSSIVVQLCELSIVLEIFRVFPSLMLWYYDKFLIKGCLHLHPDYSRENGVQHANIRVQIRQGTKHGEKFWFFFTESATSTFGASMETDGFH